MTNVPEMGMPNDMRRRQLLVRTDDDSQQKKVLHAWELIYERNYVVNTSKIKELLRDQSLVPTTVSEDASKSALIWCTNTVAKNTFSDKLSAFGFNLFAMLVVDLLHEFELGVWKAVFTHLLHILDSFKHGKLHEIDHRCIRFDVSFQAQVAQWTWLIFRYCQVPSFGRDTIQCFSRNSLEMKRMAAHDFEDLLQVSPITTWL